MLLKDVNNVVAQLLMRIFAYENAFACFFHMRLYYKGIFRH